MSSAYGSYSAYSDSYYSKNDQLNSDGPGSVQIPQTDFDPLYSDIANYDSEIDTNFLNISDLGISNALSTNNELSAPLGGYQMGASSFMPAMKLNPYVEDLSSEPPMPEDIETEGCAQSEPIPPSSPPREVNRNTLLEAQLHRPHGGYRQHRQLPSFGSTSYPYRHPQQAWSQPYLHSYAYDTNIMSEPPQLPDQLQSDIQYSEPMATQPLYSVPEYGDLPSSPPSSPEKVMPTRAPNLDSLGISHPFEHRPRSSISRIIDQPPEAPMLPASSPGDIQPSLTSPNLVPPMPKQAISPYISGLSTQRTSARTSSRLPPPPPLMTPNSCGPDLSPALSEASSVSPDPESDTFSWQPVVTAPYSEDSEAIIEQQRKPKQKRRSCLPDGVVDEYVGTTEQEGVHICLFPNCQRLFRRTYNLRSHIQTHLCDRPYVCKVCDANFVRPHDLRRHERCHSNAKPFVCPCGKGFNRQDAMQRHRQREICEGAIYSGIPKSPRPRGRPKGRKNTPNQSPTLSQSPQLSDNTPVLKHSPYFSQSTTPVLTQAPDMGPEKSPVFAQAASIRPSDYEN